MILKVTIMRRTLDWLGGMDFVHFALLVSLLRGSGPQPPPSIIPTTTVGNVGHYEETLTRHKAVLDDLHGLRDDLSLDLPAALRDISAYVLQHQMTTTNLQVQTTTLSLRIYKQSASNS